jgi:hypothetical protein
MTWIGNLFCIGLVFGVGAACLAGGRWNGLIAIVGAYAMALATIGFIAVSHNISILPYLVPWVAAPAFGSLVGGSCVTLTRPGVLAALLGVAEQPERQKA